MFFSPPLPKLLRLAFYGVLCLFVPVAVVAETTAPPAAVFLVRHAEKEKEKDPRLTRAGHHRTAELARILGDAGLDAIYATEWRRTRATAAPIAVASGLETRIVSTDEAYARRIADIVMQEHAGEVVLIVGHSNTTPPVLEALGVEAPEIPDHQYDDLFLVVWHGGEPRLLSLHYGEPTP